MPPVIAALFVGALTYLGRAARNEPMTIKTVVGVGGLALMLSLIEQADKKLAQQFGLLIIVGTLLAHWQVIVNATGLNKPDKPVAKPTPPKAGGGGGGGGGGSW